MADSEQLAKVNEGVKAWNDWRKANPEIVPDLSRAELNSAKLSRANLSDTNLRGASLRGAYLGGADLSDANLRAARLRGAYVGGANLRQANLYLADFSEADLTRAGLCGAHLNWAHLSGANLRGADLTGAIIGYTTFGDNDLGDVKGLETVRHDGPSTIGIDTVYRSHGKIPLEFLRGAGVPENFIENMPYLFAGGAIQFYSCFISYSTKDQEFADRLYADLQNKGVRCWFAPHDLKIGDKFQEVIEERIRVYEKLLIILSESSVNSDWVEREVQAAMEKERRLPGDTVLFPIRLDEAVMQSARAWAADIRRTRHIGDFRKWKDHDSLKNVFERLLRDLKTEGSKAA